MHSDCTGSLNQSNSHEQNDQVVIREITPGHKITDNLSITKKQKMFFRSTLVD